MIDSIRVIGAGRVGSAIIARLRERRVDVATDGAVAETAGSRGLSPGRGSKSRGRSDVVLMCVPDGAIREVARSVEHGPWVGHVSGATPLAALEPHVRRFSLHPLQTFTLARGPEQLDGAWAAITADTEEARAVALELAALLGLTPFDLDDAVRPLYHAGAAVASNYLVTLHRIASDLFEAAGAPPEALEPLMRRTIENGFELTGPIARGDWATVDAHRGAIRAARPELAAVYDALAEITAA